MVENPNGRPQLYLTRYHPFTPREADVIVKTLFEGKSYKQIAYELGIKLSTVKNIMNGDRGKHRGVYGKVDKYTGERPRNHNELLRILLGDVILFSGLPKNINEP
mgnify:FL=1